MHIANSHVYVCLWQFLVAACGSPYNSFHFAPIVWLNVTKIKLTKHNVLFPRQP